jgi:hypothetical protein
MHRWRSSTTGRELELLRRRTTGGVAWPEMVTPPIDGPGASVIDAIAVVANVTVYQREEAPPLARPTNTRCDVLATNTSATPNGNALSVHGMLAADDDDTSHDAPDTLVIGTVGVEVSLCQVRKRLVIVRRIAATHRGWSQFTPAFGATHVHALTTATFAMLHNPTAALPQYDEHAQHDA